MARTDEHRPSAINPADYQFVAFEYLKLEDFGMCSLIISERERIRAHMERTGGTYSCHQHGGNCHICGAHCIYTALFYHAATNSYIRTGLDCAEKLEYCDGVEAFRREVRTALEQKAGKRKAQALLELDGVPLAWTIYTATDFAGDRREEPVIRDMVDRLVKYGSLSDNAMSYLRRLVDQVARRAEIDAQRAAESEAAAPVPVTDKRVTLCGTIISIKVPGKYDCGPVRMLVKTTDGYKLWGSLPADLSDVQRGASVQFDAKIKPSQKDPKFGYFSRPTKASVISAA